MSVLLKKSNFKGISSKELGEQLEAKKKCQDKLPTWYSTPLIYYANKLNIEQTSSEITAQYKSRIVSGKTLIDITGGFGVDSYYFAKKISHVYHCEINENLSEIATYNFQILGLKNIQNIIQNGIEFLTETNEKFNWVFVDPSRRNESKGKVFFLADCLPNVPQHLDLFFGKSDNILIKTSPLLDFSIGIKELKFVKEIHVVAVNNEVKELLWVLEKNYLKEVAIKTINLKKTGEEVFGFSLSEEKDVIPNYGPPSNYLYEPNAAILKSGAFKLVGKQFLLNKLQEHSHLYTSENVIDFPGRRFKIEMVLPYSKKEVRSLKLTKANITTRNFPESVTSIRKKFKIKDGGEDYLFFTTDLNDNYIVLCCIKT
ncbi:THUMP-like domain-containing protein [Saonia flava]